MIERLMQMKKSCERATAERQKAEGMLEAALANLKEMGYGSVEEAEEALQQLKENLANEEESIQQMIEKLEEKYPEL